MAGATGFPDVDNADPMQGPAQITDLGQHFDDIAADTVPTASALPGSGNWLKRFLLAADTGILYVCTALPGTWRKVATDADDTGWIQAGQAGGPVLGSGWANVISSGIPYQGLQARRRNGFVTVTGPVSKNAASTALTDTLFTMPVGWRPTVTAVGAVVVSTSQGLGLIRPDGTAAVSISASSGAQHTFGITYPVG